MNAAAEIIETARKAATDGNAIGKHFGFEEGRCAMLRLLLAEMNTGGNAEVLMALYSKVNELPNPNALPG